MKFFTGIRTVAEAKTLYRQLAMQYHPDRGGNTAIMQAINAEYHALLESLNGTHTRDEEGNQHEYKYSRPTEQAVMDKLAELLRVPLPGCEIWLIGTWIWVRGDTRPVRDTLKGAGLSWHSKRLCWYWKPYAFRTHYNARADLAGLARMYGAQGFRGMEDGAMATA